MQRMDVAKQVMLGEPPEVAVAHVWRDVHSIGDAVDISSAGLRALEGARRLQRPWQESIGGY